MQRDSYLPKVGSFSNYVFSYDTCLYVVGWNNSNKNLYVYNILERTWKIETKFALWVALIIKFKFNAESSDDDTKSDERYGDKFDLLQKVEEL